MDSQGALQSFVPLPVMHVGDHDEHHKVFGIKANQADIRYLLKKGSYDADGPLEGLEPRTTNRMQKVRRLNSNQALRTAAQHALANSI